MNKKDARKAMAAIRKIMVRDYGEKKKVVSQAVWDGDPYEWSSGDAVGTISAEYGLDTIDYWDDYGIDTQFEIWGKVKAETGVSVYGEWVNPGVMVIYED